MKNKKLLEIIHVSWEESERGWGSRPEGCSLHLSVEDFNKFMKKYCKRLPKEVPDVYERPAGNPEVAYASRKLYRKIKRNSSSLRLYDEKELVKSKDLVYGKIRSGWVEINR